MNATNLDEYFTTYGTLLGKQAAEATRPLHIPGVDAAVLPTFSRNPFDAQQHVIAASVKVLNRQKSLFLVAEMGTGKSLMGAAAVHAHACQHINPHFPVPARYRTLVFCPGQLVEKWEREVEDTVPDAKVHQIENWKDVIRLKARESEGNKQWRRVECPEWYIIPRDRSKLGCGWRPSFNRRDRMKEFQVRCPKCGNIQVDRTGNFLTVDALSKVRKKCSHPGCNECLWQHINKPWRFAPATYIHKQMKGFFDYFILDEAHEEKSATSEQGQAAGSLAAAAKKVVAMTGTLIGGRADHTHPLLMRLCPASLIAEGLGWDKNQAFNEVYGRLETKITTRDGGDEDAAFGRGKKKSKTVSVKPGIMPTLFGRHLMGNTIFLGLSEVADGLPDFFDGTGVNMIGVDMEDVQAAEYKVVEDALRDVVKALLQRGNKALLGTMLQTLLQYPDYPFDWDYVGYNQRLPSGEKEFVPVVKPADLPRDKVYPKEQALINYILEERAQQRQCWVYVQYTGQRDCIARLETVLAGAGIKTATLRSSVDLAKREDWIAKNAPGVDVVLSHPKLVETGMDLFDKKGSYNFPTLIFYQTGYNLFTLRQAGRRAWRIGQHKPCKVAYVYYNRTMQETAMGLMAKKMEAAQSIEGKFSTEGLVGMAGEEGSAEMALAKSLAGRMDEGAAIRSWSRVQSGGPVAHAAVLEDRIELDAETLALLRAALEKEHDA